MKKLILRVLFVTLVLASVTFCIGVGAYAASYFSLNDTNGNIRLMTDMPVYDSSEGYAFYTIGFFITIYSPDGNTSKKVFLEGEYAGSSGKSIPYDDVISEFITELGTTGGNFANNFFYGSGGKIKLSACMTLWQKGTNTYSSTYDEYKYSTYGTPGYVWVKLKTSEVSAANFSSSSLETIPVNFWDWGIKPDSMVTSARDQLNSYSTATYTINPDPMTKTYIQSYSTSGIGNRYALSFQKAVLLCNFSNGAAMAIRDYFERTITRASQLDFAVDSIDAPTQVSDSKINVTVLFMNNHFGQGKQTVPVSCSIAGGDTVTQNQVFDTDLYAGYYVSFTLNASSEGVKAITAKINGGLSGARTFDEKTYTNNELSQNVTFAIPKDLSASIASIKDANGILISSSNPAVEQQTVTVNVDWKNLSNKSLPNIPSDLSLDGNITTSELLNFAPLQTITKSYSINVGNGLSDRSLLAKINWGDRNNESNSANNSATRTFPVREYYEFSVSDLVLSPQTITDAQTFDVDFIADNWNMAKAYTNISLDVLVDGMMINREMVDFEAYGRLYKHYTFNIGNWYGTHNVVVQINWSNRSLEFNPTNNESNSQTLTVIPSRNLSLEYIPPNSNYREGIEVITSFKLKNPSGKEILPWNDLSASLDINYNTSQGLKTIFAAKDKIICPANGENLIYFKWRVPNGTAGKLFSVSGKVNPNRSINETNFNDNTSSFSTTISATPFSQVPNTQYERIKPSTYVVKRPSDNFISSIWGLWEYDGGKFVYKTFGATIIQTNYPALKADPNSPSSVSKNGIWQIKSGYGYSLSYSGTLNTPSGSIPATSDQCTSIQSANAQLPEYNYSSSQGSFYSLKNLGNSDFAFNQNTNAKNNAALNFIPVWYPDGDYRVWCTLYDCWTPAGMISGNVSSTPLAVHGNMYDDYYVK